jgi:uncharacterized protein YcgI (DUF1989 family)
MHPIDGTIVSESVIQAQGYAAFTMTTGQVLRFVDVEGQQVPDLVCFDLGDRTDELNMGNSLLLNNRRELRAGDSLYSVDCNRLMTITGYSNELSYAYGPMCSEQLNRIRYGVPGTKNCRDNFAMALADTEWKLGPREIPNAFVPFMNVGVNDGGVFEIREPTSVPGDYYDLRADVDLLVAVSNCPQELNPCNGFKATPMATIVYEPNLN